MTNDLAQQVAVILAPFLPYLTGSTVDKGKEAAAKALGGKFAEATWNLAVIVWDKIKQVVDKRPDVAKRLDKVASTGDVSKAETVLSMELEDILNDLPTETLTEIMNIVEGKSSNNIIFATQGAVAYGNHAKGNIAITDANGNINITGYQSSEKKL